MRTRFAPSPTGPLHLGHAYSALTAHDMALSAKGEFLLRIEDIDLTRARPEWEAAIYNDLRWLGLSWPEPVMRQSDRMPAYRATLQQLWAERLAFACSCTRRDVLDALSAPQEGAAPATGPDGLIYPGTCRANLSRTGTAPYPADTALRLSLARVAERLAGAPLVFTETGAGPEGQTGRITVSLDEAVETIGDIVLARRDLGTSYHLSVVLDDAAQGITHVVRGQDLFEATKIHVILQRLLGLPTPIYHHHRLIRDGDGKRLAKRDDARALAKYRAEGATPDDIRAMVGL
ncbi:tRNA glutamyl-Q(34) synthetase GluQRS [Thalassorhabdomicrobium marinisediminis]|uniref:tRNA glutamyl-Q(34) synthetase GluQRS n=1 Tax=Thalassorhabdomicrobium marinisediminis TaxID=2170577 RepID=A0A2T7FV56_9RHOB|nr:tRNA glutamyl-Q(34) synthetase GluQRS [Thalassorhabdomicrobium marinisediminis]PVA06054.1 tRNA glutamyl-Q(34) synthetase GluQRS [Thalassorhabdomicrobium marinisediminis]